jgi:hypothetical protein
VTIPAGVTTVTVTGNLGGAGGRSDRLHRVRAIGAGRLCRRRMGEHCCTVHRNAHRRRSFQHRAARHRLRQRDTDQLDLSRNTSRLSRRRSTPRSRSRTATCSTTARWVPPNLSRSRDDLHRRRLTSHSNAPSREARPRSPRAPQAGLSGDAPRVILPDGGPQGVVT